MGVLDEARGRLEALGCRVEDVALDLTRADEAFETLRALAFARGFGPGLAALRGIAKDTLIWNVEQGLALDGPAIASAMLARSEVFRTVAQLLQRFDVLAAPSAQVAPFPVEQEWVTEINDEPMPTYIDWMRSCSRITVTVHPAVSVPAGLTPAGLPVGLQLVGRYGADRQLLEIAAAIMELAPGTLS